MLAEQATLTQFFSDANARNWVIEHKHHHLLNISHALMINFSTPPHFWVETIFTTICLINIQSSPTL
jgi:hypothetical protein